MTKLKNSKVAKLKESNIKKNEIEMWQTYYFELWEEEKTHKLKLWEKKSSFYNTQKSNKNKTQKLEI